MFISMIISGERTLMPTKKLSPARLRERQPDTVQSLPPLMTFGSEMPPVRRVPVALARRFLQICTTALALALDGEDLTPLQYAVLAYVLGEPDIGQSGLAERLGIDRNNTSVIVEQLESKGLLTRRVDPLDRRSRLLRLTTHGEKLQRRMQPLTSAGQEKLLSVLAPEEQKLLLDLLARVIEGNRELARPGAGRRKRTPRKLRTQTR